jgi:hypothetical protein
MKLRTKLTAAAVSALVAASPALVAPVLAGSAPASTTQTTTTPPPATPQKTAAATQAPKRDAEAIKTVREAYDALSNIHAARLAIFSGDTTTAGQMVTLAKSDLDKAGANAKDFAVKTSKTAGDNEMYLPFDSSISLVEGFKPDAEKKPAIEEANKHLAAGQSKKAVETLKLANVDVTISAAIIPLNKTVSHVADAQKLMQDGKYYEANLALKAVEDSVFVDAYSVDSVPVQGS